jgi:RNA-directed DNA polymerase
MPYSEMEAQTRARLSLIAERARREPRFQFTSLAHLLNAGFLRGCYLELGRNRASGIDEVSWEDYGKRLEENLTELVARMKAKRYRPQPAKRVYIPKNEHEKRPLGLPALEDKIVQKGIAAILESIYEADFRDCSYGFRPGRGCHQALYTVNQTLMNQPVNHVVEGDIKGFFDHVSHEWLMRMLAVRIQDPSLILLIRRFLQAGYQEGNCWHATEQGTPQGGNLSPMLANIFLHYVLDEWFEKKVKPQMRGFCQLVRYADDFVCLVQYQEEAKYLEQSLRERFARFGLELHPEKTRTIRFGRFEQQNARRQGRRANTFEFLGLTHFVSQSRSGTYLVGRQTSGKKFRQRCREMSQWLKAVRNVSAAKDWWGTLASKLRGHYQYYGVSGNYEGVRRFYVATVRAVFYWLNRRSQRRTFDWKRFTAYLERYPLPQPHLVHSFYRTATPP